MTATIRTLQAHVTKPLARSLLLRKVSRASVFLFCFFFVPSRLAAGAEDVSFRGGNDQVRVVPGELLVHEGALRDLRVFLDVVVLGELEQTSVRRSGGFDAAKVEENAIVSARRHDPPLLLAFLGHPRELPLEQRRAFCSSGVFGLELEQPRRRDAIAGFGAEPGAELLRLGVSHAGVKQHREPGSPSRSST